MKMTKKQRRQRYANSQFSFAIMGVDGSTLGTSQEGIQDSKQAEGRGC